MRIVFAGSAALACPALERLVECPDLDVRAVITQPDRPSGRKLKLHSCPVKTMVAEHPEWDLPVLSPENINDPLALEQIRQYEADVIAVVAYGQIFREPLLQLAPYGCINLHASLLPKYRGAAPYQWAVINGDKVTGVTTMQMDRGMDTGDIILQCETPVGNDETAGELHDRLAVLGAELLVETLSMLKDGTLERHPQDHDRSSMAPKLCKQDGWIDWALPAEVLRNRVRGMNPWPVCHCEVPAGTGKLLRVFNAAVEDGQGQPGEVIDDGDHGPLVATGDGALRLLEVQPPGGKVMHGGAFLRGHPLLPGVILG